MLEHRLTEAPSGVRVVTETVPGVRSVALGMWVGSGSRLERPEEAGLSHLLEHLLFRGTERFGSAEIDELFDAMGSELNASTGKETTSVYARVLDLHLERAVEVMGDMVFRPVLRDLEQEREIVLEEIAMGEDEPQDKVFDALAGAIFGDHPLGRPVIGRAEVIAGVERPALEAFHASRYMPANVVVAAAGSVDHDALVASVERAVQARPGDRPSEEPAPADAVPRVAFETKRTEQFHVCLGGPGIARGDDRRYALRVLDAILGGTASSRLFQKVREDRGLAYSVFTFASQYRDAGQFGLYLGTRAENLAEALTVIGEELRRAVEDPASPDELGRAKEHMKGRIVLGLESPSARMNRLGGATLHHLPLHSLDETIERIDAVTVDDLRALAADLVDPAGLSAAAIGPDEELFRAALAPLGGALPEAA